MGIAITMFWSRQWMSDGVLVGILTIHTIWIVCRFDSSFWQRVLQREMQAMSDIRQFRRSASKESLIKQMIGICRVTPLPTLSNCCNILTIFVDLSVIFAVFAL